MNHKKLDAEAIKAFNAKLADLSNDEETHQLTPDPIDARVLKRILIQSGLIDATQKDTSTRPTR